MQSIDRLSTPAKVIAMDIPGKTPSSPIGQASQEAASERYESDENYRAAHDRLAPYRAIAHAVILARVARHLTQRDLAGMLGTTDSAISRIESGERAISLETLRKLGVALDLVFMVGSTEGIDAAAIESRIVVVPEAPFPHGPAKLARGGVRAIPAVPALQLSADSDG